MIPLCSIFATINCGTEEMARADDAPPTFCERKFQVADFGWGVPIRDDAIVDIVQSACNELGGVGDRDALAEQIIATELNSADYVLWEKLGNYKGL